MVKAMLNQFDAKGVDPRLLFRRRLGLTVTASELGVVLVRGTETIAYQDSEPIGPDDTRAS